MGALGDRAPGVGADPLVDDGHAAVLVPLQLPPRGREPHHLGQQPPQQLDLCKGGALTQAQALDGPPGRRRASPQRGGATPRARRPVPARRRPSGLPAGAASVATNTVRSPSCSRRRRTFRTAPSRLGTSSLCPQMKSFLLRCTPRYGPPSEEPSLTWRRRSRRADTGVLVWGRGRGGDAREPLRGTRRGHGSFKGRGGPSTPSNLSAAGGGGHGGTGRGARPPCQRCFPPTPRARPSAAAAA